MKKNQPKMKWRWLTSICSGIAFQSGKCRNLWTETKNRE